MVAFVMVMHHVLGQRPTKVLLTERNNPVLSENAIEPSRGSMIVTEESSKSLAATDGAVSTRRCEAFWRNQPIVKTLVIPFPVVVRRECGERSAQVGFAEDDDPIQALLLDRPHEALAYALQLGAWNGVWTIRMPASAKVCRKVALHLVSRSQMRMRDPRSTPSSAPVSTRATWPTKA
jgi:hypothetical protein